MLAVRSQRQLSAGLGAERAGALDLAMTLQSHTAQSLHLPAVDENERFTRPIPQRVVVKIKGNYSENAFQGKNYVISIYHILHCISKSHFKTLYSIS